MFTNDFGHWTTTISIPEETPFGFVYQITEISTGKIYFGKKQIQKVVKKKPLKGKTRKRKEVKESDWREYTSSSTYINDNIAKNGKADFKFEILCWCCSKSELAYREAKIQFEHDVLLYPDKYLNGIINLRVSSVKLS